MCFYIFVDQGYAKKNACNIIACNLFFNKQALCMVNLFMKDFKAYHLFWEDECQLLRLKKMDLCVVQYALFLLYSIFMLQTLHCIQKHNMLIADAVFRNLHKMCYL